MKLTYLYLPVDDLAAAESFYRDRLGLEEAWREGDSTIAFWSPDRAVQLMVDTDDYPAGSMYEVDDLTAWQAANSAVPVRVPRYEIPGGSVAGYQDPAGNVFYVFDQAQQQS